MKDYGTDPIDKPGYVKMVPSGDIVTVEESILRLKRVGSKVSNDCMARSWNQIEQMQGGRLKN